VSDRVLRSSAHQSAILLRIEGVDLDGLVPRRIRGANPPAVLIGDDGGLPRQLDQRVTGRVVDPPRAHGVPYLGLHGQSVHHLIQRGLETAEPRLVRRRNVNISGEP
jgi:hypothetical protein